MLEAQLKNYWKTGKIALVALAQASMLSATAMAACCYFAAVDKDVKQPGQRAFITWDDKEKLESFTVQPQFEGNASDFGMVIPTPAKPKLQEMPRDFFRALAVFTILEPMDMSKYKSMSMARCCDESASNAQSKGGSRPAVRVLERGVVGNLDYKILEADRADALYEWLKTNKYSYAGDQATLEFYVRQHWNFTVMKIDPRQMKSANGKFSGDISPTRFTFTTAKPIYPLRITRISVKDHTDVLLYVMARKKMDMGGDWSYHGNFFSMWQQAITYALPEKLTAQEKEWQSYLKAKPLSPQTQGAALEWSGKLTAARLNVLTGKARYNRDAPGDEVKKLKVLQGHLKPDWYLTKFRKNFAKAEMDRDISLIESQVGTRLDDLEYTSILPTSPP